MSPRTETSTLPGSVIWLLVAMSLVWGGNWPIMKLVMAEMPPLSFRAFCLLIGSAGLFLIAIGRGISVRVPEGQWPNLVTQAVLNMAAWNVLAVFGLRYMDSGRAAIIAYTFPVWSTLLSVWWLREPLTVRKVTGLVLGMGGMALLLGSDIAAVGRSPTGALLLSASAVCWAVGTVVMKKRPVGLSPLPLAAWQVLIASIPLSAGALMFENGPYHPFGLSPGPMFGVLYNAMGSFVFCNWAWFKIANSSSPSVSSLSTLIIPVVGVISGALLLGERPAPADLAALALVIAALATVILPPRKARRNAA